MHRVERARHLAELFAGEHRHGRDREPFPQVFGGGLGIGEQVLHGRGQPVLGHLQCRPAQDPQGAQQGPRDDHRQHARDEQDAEHHAAVPERRRAGLRRQRVRAFLQLDQQCLLHLVGEVHRVGRRSVPLVRVEAREVLAVFGARERGFHHVVADVDDQADHRVVEHPLLVRSGEGAVVAARGGQFGFRAEQGARAVAVEGALRERLGHHRPLDRHLVLDPGQCVARQPHPGEFRVGDVGRGGVADVEQAGDQLAVGAQHGVGRERRMFRGEAEAAEHAQPVVGLLQAFRGLRVEPRLAVGEGAFERTDGLVDAGALGGEVRGVTLPVLGDEPDAEVALALQFVQGFGDGAVDAAAGGELGQLLGFVQVGADPQADERDDGQRRDEEDGEELRAETPVPQPPAAAHRTWIRRVAALAGTLVATGHLVSFSAAGGNPRIERHSNLLNGSPPREDPKAALARDGPACDRMGRGPYDPAREPDSRGR